MKDNIVPIIFFLLGTIGIISGFSGNFESASGGAVIIFRTEGLIQVIIGVALIVGGLFRLRGAKNNPKT